MDLVRSLAHFDELKALVQFKLFGAETVISKCNYDSMNADARTCYSYLNLTSRSFAAVIQALEGDLRHAVCIFYLVLRALDTVEDDMSIEIDRKRQMLIDFHNKLEEEGWNFYESTEKDKVVLENFCKISAEFRRLAPCYRTVIKDVCARMGKGMSLYLESKVNTMKEWDMYCHYVAGLVGIGLSQLFSASELESSQVGKDEELANSMGLFLQKTNIIRDYLEDALDKRYFWPKEAWSKYTDSLDKFQELNERTAAMNCLNELVTNALAHVPDVIKYMSRIKNQSVFNFCAIPQVMAIATLERCYNNPKVFTGVVKIRKGEAVRMIMETTDMSRLKSIFHFFSQQILFRVPDHDKNASLTRQRCRRALELCTTTQRFKDESGVAQILLILLIALVAYVYWAKINANTS